MSKVIDPNLSAQLNEILNSDGYISTDDIPNLTTNTVDQICELAVDKEKVYNHKTRTKAIIFLPKIHGEREFEILKNILADNTENRYLRIASVKALVNFEPTKAEPVLVENLMASDPYVKARVIRALGKIGGNESLKSMNKIEIPQDERLKRHFQFAKTLIRYRIGSDELSLPDDAKIFEKRGSDSSAVPLVMSKIGTQQIDKAMTKIAGPFYGITICRDYAFQFACGRSKFIILLNQDCFGEDSLQKLMSKGKIAGLIITSFVKNEPCGVNSIIFTSPQESGIKIDIYRYDGILIFAGEGRTENRTINWNVQGLNKQGSLIITFNGKIDEKGLSFLDCRSSMTAVKTKNILI